MLKSFKIRFLIIVKKIANFLGIQLKMSSEESFMRLLTHHQIDLILDVGANNGQFASMCYALGFKGRIVSFEPIIEAHEVLKKKSENKALWTVYDRVALGSEDGEVEINISKNSVSSSILPMNDLHVVSAPDSIYVGKQKTPLLKLDSILNEIKKESKNIFLKIDTQGYEDQVLDGATNSLKDIKGVLLELSLVPLYKGQLLMKDYISKMENLGFNLHQIDSGFTDPLTGRVLQVEGVFFKE